MKAVDSVAAKLGHLRAVHLARVALALLLLVVLVRASQGVIPGTSGPLPSASASSAPSAIAAAAMPSPTGTPEPSIAPTPTPAPNLTFQPQTRQSVLITPKPGWEFYHGDPTRKEIYITIDDCQNWSRIDTDLETARSKGVQLTLFPAGKYIDSDEANAERELQKAVAYGDEIDNHTYSHTLIADNAPEANIKADLDSQMYVVRNALKDPNYREWFVRTPYGAGMGNPNLVSAAYADGLAIVKWTLDTSGYEAGSTVASVMHNVFDSNYFRNGAIILMHDDYTDMQALPQVIDTIISKGYSVGGPLKNILINANESVAMAGGDAQQALSWYPEIVMSREDGPLAG
jgi:peptidoglycan/xylan/chitin deacetylase (PgdA/CDA1 family)